LCGKESATNICVEVIVPVVDINIDSWLWPVDSRVVDQNIDLTESRFCSTYALCDLFQVADINCNLKCLPPKRS
jgi:hypothetical protein